MTALFYFCVLTTYTPTGIMYIYPHRYRKEILYERLGKKAGKIYGARRH